MKRYIFPQEPDTHCELQPDSMAQPIIGVPDHHPTNGAPCISFDVPSTVPNRNGAHLTLSKKGFATLSYHGILETFTVGGGGYEVDVFPMVKSGGVRPFVRDGKFCRYADDGTELLLNESTAFRLFARYRAGEARADDFAQSCVDNHFNLVRVSGMQDTTLYLPEPELRYRIFPDDESYYRDLDAFMDWTATYGLYVDFVSCMQTQTLMPNRDAQVRHVQKVWEVLHARSAFNSKVNEQYVHDNTIEDATRLLLKPAGSTFLLSNGSKGAGDESPLEPMGDLLEYHGNDLSEWWRKAHNPMEMANNNGNRCGYVSESQRTDKEDNKVGREKALIHYEDDGKTQAAMTTACVIHTPEGKNADPFDYSLPHIDAHNRGVFAVPIEQRRGDYRRYGNPEVLRDYSMGTYRWQVRF